MIPEGTIKELSREDISIETIKSQAKELMLFGGKKCVPILSIDGHRISDKAGEVTLSFQEYLQAIETGVHDKVELTSFKIRENM